MINERKKQWLNKKAEAIALCISYPIVCVMMMTSGLPEAEFLGAHMLPRTWDMMIRADSLFKSMKKAGFSYRY